MGYQTGHLENREGDSQALSIPLAQSINLVAVADRDSFEQCQTTRLSDTRLLVSQGLIPELTLDCDIDSTLTDPLSVRGLRTELQDREKASVDEQFESILKCVAQFSLPRPGNSEGAHVPLRISQEGISLDRLNPNTQGSSSDAIPGQQRGKEERSPREIIELGSSLNWSISLVRAENRGATPEFARIIQGQVDKLPSEIKTLLKENGVHIVIADTVPGFRPALKGGTPPGWPNNMTWENADGFYSPDEKIALVTERLVDEGVTIKSNRAKDVFSHEIGHAVDFAMGDLSLSDEFKEAYQQDLAKLSLMDRDRHSYLLQAGDRGIRETFAEVFGALNGSSSNPYQANDLLRSFPHVAAYLRCKLDGM